MASGRYGGQTVTLSVRITSRTNTRLRSAVPAGRLGEWVERAIKERLERVAPADPTQKED